MSGQGQGQGQGPARPGDAYTSTITGNVSGQVAVGHGNTQSQTVTGARPEPTAADLAALQQALDALKARIAAEAPPAQQAAALERVGELEQAITTAEPTGKTLTRLEYVRDWFADNLPKLAGAVTGIVTHPVVGKLVESAGEGLVAEFRRFGQE